MILPSEKILLRGTDGSLSGIIKGAKIEAYEAKSLAWRLKSESLRGY